MRSRASRGAAGLLVGAALLLACGEGEDRARSEPSAREGAPAAAEREAVARVEGEAVSRAELDAPLRLRLYELEREAYRLRRARLRRLVLERLGEDPEALGRAAAEERLGEAERRGEVEIRLEPPERPRLSVGAEDAPFRGPPDAAVTLVVFCDFASPHCARFQAALAALREAYPERLRVAHRDAPRPYHRHAVEAAMAARCAHEQSAYAAYHDALYAHWDALEPERFRRLARSLGLDAEAFDRCLAEARTREAVVRDAAIARRLGVASVPVTFVNGLYVKGPASQAELGRMVREELARLGEAPEPVASSRGEAEGGEGSRETELPLELRGTLVADDPERSVAIIRKEEAGSARSYRPGDRILEGVVLDAVEPERAWLRNRGRRELLRLSRERRGGTPPPRPGRVLEAAPEPTGVVPLRREAVDRALEERESLAQRLQPGRLELDDGRRLLKLREVPEGSLYERMGLEPGDVLMQVNGRFVHDAENPLWEALRAEGRVELTVMRGGFPKTFAYAIE